MPRSHGFQERFQSDRPIHGRPTGITWTAERRRWAATQSPSPTAKMATATTTTSMPSDSSGWPKVRRAWPLTESSPTSPMVSPMNSAENPRTRELPSTAVTATKASAMTAR